jgi:hypothetical protein
MVTRSRLKSVGAGTAKKDRLDKVEMGSFEKEKIHDEVEEYNGWSNRETWAVKLHWDNNEGDYNYFTGQAKEFKDSGKDAFEFADFLKETAEEIADQVKEGEGTEEAKNFVEDVGSLWRVDWNEIAKAYYEELNE